MTEKQENILKAALELFAKEGYHATSTSKVAKHAGVSEGLIFRHFGNKEGLLKSLITAGEERVKQLYANIVLESDPKQVIRKTIEMPFNVPKEEHEFWKLQFKLKWELEQYGNEKMEPLALSLTNAFKKLGYEEPEKEAELIIHLLDGIGGAILKGSITDQNAMKTYLLKKYKV